jgi:hypothetical protein
MAGDSARFRRLKEAPGRGLLWGLGSGGRKGRTVLNSLKRHLSPSLVVSCVALFVALGSAGYAATGGNFILGQANDADATSALSSNVATGPTLSLTNSGGKPAAAFVTDSGKAPFTVNQGTKVSKLNADKIDGIDSLDLLKTTTPAGGDLTGTLGALQIGPGVVGNPELADDSVGETKIQNGAVTSAKVLDGALSGVDVLDESIGATDIGTDAVGSDELGANSVGSAEIQTDAVASDELGANSVGSAEIQTDAVQATEIADNSIDGGEIVDNSLGQADLASGSVAGSELAANAVDGSKVADNSLTTADLAGTDVSGTVSYAAGSVASGRCIQSIVSVGGAQVGQIAVIATNGPLQNGVLLYATRVATADHVTIDVCNFSGTTLNAITSLPVRVVTFG